MRLRVEVDGEPFAPGDTVAGRVVVEDGGRARSLSVRLAFVERTESFSKVAREAATEPIADGELAAGAVFAFRLALPADALPDVTTPQGRIGWELRARVDRAGQDPIVDRPLSMQRGYTAPDRERWPSG